jgi:Domain of unknown function (DUF4893)
MSVVCAAVALAAAANAPTPAPCKTIPPAANWRAAATEGDRSRLHDWRDAFVKALDEAKGDHAAEIAREGQLLAPDAALGGGAIPAGDYKCRTLKLGSQGNGGLTYVPYRVFNCRVSQAGGTQRLEKLDGSQRPFGKIFAAEDRQQVFLGTLMLGDETRPMEYGRDPDRDLAGLVERIGPNSWRLVLPYPRFESTLDVIELTPAR